MGNRSSHPYTTWACTRNMPHEIPHNIRHALEAVEKGKSLVLVEALSEGLQFRKTRLLMNRSVPPRNQSSDTEFRYTYRMIQFDMTFRYSSTHGWSIFIHSKKFPYILLKKRILYVNTWYRGTQPSMPQMRDLRRIQWGQKTRYIYETDKEYRNRRLRAVACESEVATGNISCKICFTNVPSLALIPCGHTICPSCWNQTSNTCPWCRQRVEWSQRLFLDP